ncbi:hypothetical protein BDV3_004524 [Batrachochytrium dendrobatidis]|nr:hypothetical protein O5D80_006463 [Batrachochytrium dendrobatidis]
MSMLVPSGASNFIYPSGWHSGSSKHIPKERYGRGIAYQTNYNHHTAESTFFGLLFVILLIIFMNMWC